jgi:hypothetical protein
MCLLTSLEAVPAQIALKAQLTVLVPDSKSVHGATLPGLGELFEPSTTAHLATRSLGFVYQM